MHSSAPEPAFAVWLTGLPASGKSTIAAALVRRLGECGRRVAVLESDVLRQVLTPHPTYLAEERETFYGAMAWIGHLLVEHGVDVVFDGTANRCGYRDGARALCPRFAEAFVDTPLERCIARDPKGIYRDAVGDEATTVPGVGPMYEPPENPELVIDGTADADDQAARIVGYLDHRGWLTGGEHAKEVPCTTAS